MLVAVSGEAEARGDVPKDRLARGLGDERVLEHARELGARAVDLGEARHVAVERGERVAFFAELEDGAAPAAGDVLVAHFSGLLARRRPRSDP